ncbi:IS1182 family transposase [Paenactinomyces guangxiensis]|uniref:IS1182 family transposase n=1 Tax=Paenactinomyces guangxiensis TaxID=1490290 RepID=A0A7W1WUZ1_9BACL|nr:IS1182 family transposase [Paenactinomyces guangxiensis]MBA4496590.1 IS1182 family transposase [Paenactinomyces guangxiensis]MBH8593709.1 IS1182 family transposase [Paenactinomyces guangxiensis]
MSNATFVDYSMNQLFLPMDLEELIPPRHVVRVVNDAIDQVKDDVFLKHYPGGGRSSYHPKMMTKIIVFAYTQKIYSSRLIAKAVRENIPFMWLSARQTPDFRTINRFRSERMKQTIDEVFSSILQLLIEEGYIKLENYFLDGTKIEANANRYTYVWKKNVDRHQKNLQVKIHDLLCEIDEIEKQEMQTYQDHDLEELGEHSTLTAEKLEETVAQLEQRLQEEPENKPLQKRVKKIQDEYLPRYQRYEEQQAIFQERNSYSKTDHDATFMRTKEDHLQNGQLKPCYNLQVGTENQFIVGYSVHQRPGDTKCMISHLEGVRAKLGTLPKAIIADAGYGSEENYAYLDRWNVKAYVKFNTFHRENSKKWKRDISKVENWSYDEEKDEFICAGDKRLTFRNETKEQTDSGYEITKRNYQCHECEGCPLREQCTKSTTGRQISVSPALMEYKKKAREILGSDHGRTLSVQRSIEVESVFGHFKENRSLRRFFLRGLPKVSIEVGLLSLAHNLLKKTAAQMKSTGDKVG